MSETQYTQVVSDQLTIEKLADGSTAILDQRTKNVHSLNASATMVWEACKGGATLAEIRRALEAKAGKPVDETFAESALTQLRKVDLIQTNAPAELSAAARRTTLLRAAVIAVPVVLTLAFAEQRNHALLAASAPLPKNQ